MELEKLKTEKARLDEDTRSDDAIVTYGGQFSPRTGITIGEKTSTLGERKKTILEDIAKKRKGILENIIKSQEYQEKMAEVESVEFFNEDNSLKSFSELMDQNAPNDCCYIYRFLFYFCTRRRASSNGYSC